jgi:renalase
MRNETDRCGEECVRSDRSVRGPQTARVAVRSASVAVVGAGIAGAACARALAGAGVAVQVLDRGSAPGGRMSSRTLHGRAVDLGASYLTAQDPGFEAVVDGWLARRLARPWTDRFCVATPDGIEGVKAGPLRYGAAGGLRSLVLDLLAGVPVASGVEVAAVTSDRAGALRVDGTAYDAVVLAMPDPQALRLLDAALSEERAVLADTVWEPVLAVAAGYAARTWDDGFDGCFVNDSDVLGWIADDGRRRGDGAAVLVAHSTASYAQGRLVDPPAALPPMLTLLRSLLDLDADPVWTVAQRWSLARPAGTREQPFHLGPARVGLCGDGWGSPRVETAWRSGQLLGEELARRLG